MNRVVRLCRSIRAPQERQCCDQPCNDPLGFHSYPFPRDPVQCNRVASTSERLVFPWPDCSIAALIFPVGSLAGEISRVSGAGTPPMRHSCPSVQFCTSTALYFFRIAPLCFTAYSDCGSLTQDEVYSGSTCA